MLQVKVAATGLPQREGLTVETLAIIVIVGLIFYFLLCYSVGRRNGRNKLLEALGPINNDLEKGGHQLELVDEPRGRIKIVDKKIWSDEEIERKKEEDGKAVLSGLGESLFADQSNEAKQLLAFLDEVSQAYNGKRIQTPMDAGQAWFGCMDCKPDSVIAKRFKVLCDAWLKK